MEATIDLKPFFESLSDADYINRLHDKIKEDSAMCDNYCKKKATRGIIYKDGRGRHVTQVCDDCYHDEELWKDTELIKVTNL